MKKFLPVFILACLSFQPQKTKAQSVSFQVFYDQLSPYGSWVNYQQYGYVWIPTAVESGFRPYGSGGHWVYTEDGWTWVSDYNWGWAAFHYGNWFYDDSYGWMWRPGYDWAPAWVTWGEYGGNYGWAPIGPNINIGISYASYRPPAYCWTFVPRAYMNRPDIGHYYVSRSTHVTINNITVINNIHNAGGRPQFMRGPQPQSVERYTHQSIRPLAIRQSNTAGRGQVQNGQLAIYRPTINRTPAARPAPPRVQNLQNVRPATLPARNPQANNNPTVRPPSNYRPPNNNNAVRHDQPANRPSDPNNNSNRPPMNNNPSANRPQHQNQPPANNHPQQPLPQHNQPTQPNRMPEHQPAQQQHFQQQQPVQQPRPMPQQHQQQQQMQQPRPVQEQHPMPQQQAPHMEQRPQTENRPQEPRSR